MLVPKAVDVGATMIKYIMANSAGLYEAVWFSSALPTLAGHSWQSTDRQKLAFHNRECCAIRC